MTADRSAALIARIGSYAGTMRVVLRWLWRAMIGPAAYRPGAHYMRGPGPKCAAKTGERGHPSDDFSG